MEVKTFKVNKYNIYLTVNGHIQGDVVAAFHTDKDVLIAEYENIFADVNDNKVVKAALVCEYTVTIIIEDEVVSLKLSSGEIVNKNNNIRLFNRLQQLLGLQSIVFEEWIIDEI